MLAARLAITVAFVTVACAACPTAQNDDGKCKNDAQCGEFKRCNASTGACLCTSDDACDGTEFCNLAGSCQGRQQCLSNTECRTAETPSSICNVKSGECVTFDAVSVQCVDDAHCPFGFFCDGTRCAEGCRENGDCPLGEPCIATSCNTAPNACNNPGYCEFGQTCTTSQVCVDHPDADILCERCDPFTGFDCATCLIDPTVPGTLCTSDNQCSAGGCVHFQCGFGAECPGGESCSFGECSGHCGDFFCGNDSCDDVTSPCPRGYGCFVLTIVSNNLCTRAGGECGTGSSCSADNGTENQENGACSCLSDADCPNGIACVNPGLQGACVQGSTCAPTGGLTCGDLR